MTIKQWKYSDDGDETAAEYLLNTIIGKVLLVLTWSSVRMSSAISVLLLYDV